MNEADLEEALFQRSASFRSQIVCESKYIDRFESILVSRAHLLRHLVLPAELHNFSGRRSSALYKDSQSSFAHVFNDTQQYPIVRDAIGPFVCRAVPLDERTQTDELQDYGVALVQLLNCRLSNGIGYLETLQEVQQRAKNLHKIGLQNKCQLPSDCNTSAISTNTQDEQLSSNKDLNKDEKFQSQEKFAIEKPDATTKGVFDIDDTIAVIQALDSAAVEDDFKEVWRCNHSSASDLTSEKRDASHIFPETHTNELSIEETPQAHFEAAEAQEYSLKTLGEDETSVDNLSEVGYTKFLKSNRQSDEKKFSTDKEADDDNGDWKSLLTAEDFRPVEVEDIMQSGSSLSEYSSQSSSTSSVSSQHITSFQRRISQDPIPEDAEEKESNISSGGTSLKSESSDFGSDDHMADQVHYNNRRTCESSHPADEAEEFRSRQQQQNYFLKHVNTSLLQIRDEQRGIADTIRRMESWRCGHNCDLSVNQTYDPYPRTEKKPRPWLSVDTTNADSQFGKTLRRNQELKNDTKSMDGTLFRPTYGPDQFTQVSENHEAFGSVFSSRERDDLDVRIQACLRRSQRLFESCVRHTIDHPNNGVARRRSDGNMQCRSCNCEKGWKNTTERSLEALEVAENERHQEIMRLISQARQII